MLFKDYDSKLDCKRQLHAIIDMSPAQPFENEALRRQDHLTGQLSQSICYFVKIWPKIHTNCNVNRRRHFFCDVTLFDVENGGRQTQSHNNLYEGHRKYLMKIHCMDLIFITCGLFAALSLEAVDNCQILPHLTVKTQWNCESSFKRYSSVPKAALLSVRTRTPSKM